MNILMIFVILGLSFFGMAIALLITRKCLQKSCSVSSEECTCKNEEKNPSISES